jgi:L-malate glycosyltransferase
VKLLIVGSGPQLDVMNRNSKRLGIDDASVMLPTVRDVGPVVRSMDIFVSSSHAEAFSNSILEAMASGCCVIASRVGGTPELVTDGQTGALFNVGDVDQLAHRLVELIQDSSLRKALGTKAAEFAADKLNIDIALRRSMEIYDDLLRRKTLLRQPLVSSNEKSFDWNYR